MLYLDNNNLTGPIPSTLGQLTNLEELHLYSNQLTGMLLPQELGNLRNLKYFYAYDNSFNGPISSSFDGPIP